MTKFNKPSFLLVPLVLSVSLVGCSGKSDGAKTASTGQNVVSANTGNDVSEAQAYSAYVSAYNHLNDMFYGRVKGLRNLLQAYKSQNLGGPVNSDKAPILYLSTSRLKNSIAALEKVKDVKLGGEYQELQQKGMQFYETAKQLQKQATSLEDYFNSKKYKEDNFAKVKAENEAFVKQWEKFNEEYTAFGQELDRIELQHRLADIQKYEKEGKLLEANREKAMLAANQILSSVNDLSDLKDAQKMQTADTAAKDLETALTKLREELDKSQDKDKYKTQSVFDSLNRLLGYWREFKTEPSARTYENMIDNYNRAVSSIR